MITSAAADNICVNGGTGDSLKKSQLEMILNTVTSYPQSGVQVFDTLITPNYGQNMYTTDTNPINVYLSMINDIEHSRIAETRDNTIWANYSPCPQ